MSRPRRFARVVGGALLVLGGIVWVLAVTIPVFLIATSGLWVAILLAVDLGIGLLCVVFGVRMVRRGLAY